MPDKKQITDEEIEQFRDAMSSPTPPPSTNSTGSALPDDDLPFPEVITCCYQPNEVVQYRHPHLERLEWKKLTRGDVHWLSSLDLHGYTLEEAAKAVKPHLRECCQHNDKYTLIIHGKGLQSGQIPILKNAIASWLPSDPRVLGFHSAKPKHGGTGAIYVHLKQTG